MSKGYASELRRILNYLIKKRNFDAFGFRIAMLERRVQHRLVSTNCKNYTDYFLYLQNNSAELDYLINALTINVSRFFRNTLIFEYIADQILPDMIHQKTKTMESLFARLVSGLCNGRGTLFHYNFDQ
jgi:chemotaxis methyl-accepting protein methylase